MCVCIRSLLSSLLLFCCRFFIVSSSLISSLLCVSSHLNSSRLSLLFCCSLCVSSCHISFCLTLFFGCSLCVSLVVTSCLVSLLFLFTISISAVHVLLLPRLLPLLSYSTLPFPPFPSSLWILVRVLTRHLSDLDKENGRPRSHTALNLPSNQRLSVRELGFDATNHPASVVPRVDDLVLRPGKEGAAVRYLGIPCPLLDHKAVIVVHRNLGVFVRHVGLDKCSLGEQIASVVLGSHNVIVSDAIRESRSANMLVVFGPFLALETVNKERYACECECVCGRERTNITTTKKTGLL